MSQPLRTTACLALLLTLAACQREAAPGPDGAAAMAGPAAAGTTTGDGPAPTTAGDAPVPPGAVDYASGIVGSQWQCGDQRVAARFDNTAGTVTITHERGELVLPQATSASGARYADANGNEFWNKGAGASLTLSGTEARQCQQVGAG